MIKRRKFYFWNHISYVKHDYMYIYIYIILHNVIRKNKIIPKFDFILSSFFIIQSFAFSKGFHISFFEKNNKYNILYTKLSLLWLLDYNELIDRSIIINNHNDIISKKIPCNQISCRSVENLRMVISSNSDNQVPMRMFRVRATVNVHDVPCVSLASLNKTIADGYFIPSFIS